MNSNTRSMLYISYPMVPISNASCGGAEQMLWLLEREMHDRGWKTAVAACDSSSVSGELFATGRVPAESDRFPEREFEHSEAVVNWLRFRDFDLVHDKSTSFWRNARRVSVPMLVTLHLPRVFYPEDLFSDLPHNVFFNCVSESQACWFRDLPRMLGVVPNGIDLRLFPFTNNKRNYLLWLGRICPEKGTHIAIEVAKRAGMPLVLAGSVYPFSSHQEYFEREIKPRIGGSKDVTFVESPCFEQKVELLRHARALIQPTLAAETSSLVAMEAMACGTPVIAFRQGALHEVVAHNETGFLVRSPAAMVAAVRDVDHIWPQACRVHVEARFSSNRMADDYEELYNQVLTESEQTMRFAA